MDIAYLIIVHHQPIHFKRLINKLNSGHVKFFVFVDKKAQFENFYIENPNVLYYKNRFNIYHGGYSQTQATIALLKMAFETHIASHYIFLSGVDYPIKSNSIIFNFFKTHPDKNFISFYPLLKNTEKANHLNDFHSVDLISKQNKVIRKLLNYLLVIINYFITKTPLKYGLMPYRGSTSWALNYKTVKYIIGVLNQDFGKYLQKYMKHCWGSDEIFFHTLILNSDYKIMCNQYEFYINQKNVLYNENKAYLHYIDWNEKREMPAILNITDFDTLKDSKYLFARKFDGETSKSLLIKIDEFTQV